MVFFLPDTGWQRLKMPVWAETQQLYHTRRLREAIPRDYYMFPPCRSSDLWEPEEFAFEC